MSELMKKIEFLWGTPIFFTRGREQKLQSFGTFSEEESPFLHAPFLNRKLMEQCARQSLPVIYKDEYQMYFICVKAREGFYLIGPVCTGELDYVQLHRFQKAYHIPEGEENCPMRTTLLRMLTFAGFLYELEFGTAVDIAALFEINALGNRSNGLEEEQIQEIHPFEEEHYHHTYQEECFVMECVRGGRASEAQQRMSMIMDGTGSHTKKQTAYYKNVAIAFVALSAREAIAGGASPVQVLRMSDVYMGRIDRAGSPEGLTEWSCKAVYEFARVVAGMKSGRISTSYTEQCKEYIHRNYQRKIHLEDVAEAIGISQGHLSRVFHQDMGMSVQDYIQKFRVERAANLLRYSQASLSEISNLMCFHSQSHFGSVFKRYMNMTPKQYRDRYKESGFMSRNEA